MNFIYYIKKSVLFSILLTLILSLTLVFTELLNPTLIKWIAVVFFISLISSSLVILHNYSSSLSKMTKLFIPVFGLLLVIYLALILFSINFANQLPYLAGSFMIYVIFIQLNILGWSNKKHTIGIKLLFLLSLLSNLFLSSILFFKIDIYEIKPFLISAILISFFLLLIGIYIQNKKIKV